MSRLLFLRLELNLTQEELCEKSGVSVRTIQRIEAGTPPKGYTLKALAKGLGISEAELVDKTEIAVPADMKWIKLINLSALPFMFLPPLNVAVPLLLMFSKKLFTPLTRELVTIQILWSLIAGGLFLTVIILNDWWGITSKYMMLVPVVWLAINLYIVLRNAAEIVKHNALRIRVGFCFF
jgi:transcriptional regulator with XRE-family HTH domain